MDDDGGTAAAAGAANLGDVGNTQSSESRVRSCRHAVRQIAAPSLSSFAVHAVHPNGQGRARQCNATCRCILLRWVGGNTTEGYCQACFRSAGHDPLPPLSLASASPSLA